MKKKWEKLQENEERLRKSSYLAHPGVRGWLQPCSNLMLEILLSMKKATFITGRFQIWFFRKVVIAQKWWLAH